MKPWMAIILFCGGLPALCQSPPAETDFDRVLGPPAAAPEYVPVTLTERSTTTS